MLLCIKKMIFDSYTCHYKPKIIFLGGFKNSFFSLFRADSSSHHTRTRTMSRPSPTSARSCHSKSTPSSCRRSSLHRPPRRRSCPHHRRPTRTAGTCTTWPARMTPQRCWSTFRTAFWSNRPDFISLYSINIFIISLDFVIILKRRHFLKQTPQRTGSKPPHFLLCKLSSFTALRCWTMLWFVVLCCFC